MPHQRPFPRGLCSSFWPLGLGPLRWLWRDSHSVRLGTRAIRLARPSCTRSKGSGRTGHFQTMALAQRELPRITVSRLTTHINTPCGVCVSPVQFNKRLSTAAARASKECHEQICFDGEYNCQFILLTADGVSDLTAHLPMPVAQRSAIKYSCLINHWWRLFLCGRISLRVLRLGRHRF